ncbi:lactonase family protein [Lacibacter luteus]|uniref:Lactonase family protein n=1 Tax=Lacibacter luteus TaxID=2508719 RepID=A0A4Q1CMS1_9BACT|nr:lactonase family protein [Lacibacter luteus]RXK61991.1 lactonase family protein [Lacibacter luteus]
MIRRITIAFICTLLLQTAVAQVKNKTLLFIGSFTGGKPDTGIYVYELNTSTGKLTHRSTVEKITNPSYLTVSPNGRFLYACTDTKLPHNGSITAFSIDSINGKLSFINKQSSGGENPVYITVHKNNRFVAAGNYTGGSVVVLTANSDGSINPFSQLIQFSDSGINKVRQEKAHIHSTVFSPGNDFLFLPDLGADKIRVFRFNAKHVKPLTAFTNYFVTTTPGSGPRHFTFHPNGKFAYCIEELGGTVAAYRYRNGKLDSIQRIFSYSKKLEAYTSADIHISPDGLFLYASNRGTEENTISIFSIDQTNGKLALVGHQKTDGDHPRNFCIDPTGNFLLVANQFTGNVVVFKRDAFTGLLTKTGTELNIPGASCLQIRTYKTR